MVLAELFPYADIVYNVLLVLYVLTVLTVIVVVLSENRNQVKSMAWVLVLVLLPVLGLVVYLIFGRSLKGMMLISRSDLRELRKLNVFPEADGLENTLSDSSRQLISLVNKLAGRHLFVGDDIEVFTTGKDKFESLQRDILAAHDYIHVQYFIIENDDVGKELIDLLILTARAAARITFFSIPNSL